MDTNDVLTSERKPVSLGQPTLTQAHWLPTHRRSDTPLLMHSRATILQSVYRMQWQMDTEHYHRFAGGNSWHHTVFLSPRIKVTHTLFYVTT